MLWPPSEVWGRAPAEKGFWCIWNWKYTSDGDKFHIFATNIYPYFYDSKPMRSIFDILHKNFQEDQLNSRRFPGGFLNSSRFPEFPGVVDTLWTKKRQSRDFVITNVAQFHGQRWNGRRRWNSIIIIHTWHNSKFLESHKSHITTSFKYM